MSKTIEKEADTYAKEMLIPMNIWKTSGLTISSTPIAIRNFAEEQTMAFGDSMNDETMIRQCGYSVAMSNGLDYIKDVASFVTRFDNNNDGIADFIENFVL